MNRLKALIRSLFAFSRGETNGFLVLLPLMALLIFSEPIYRYWFVRQPQDYSRESIRLDSLLTTWKWTQSDSVSDSTVLERQLFSFDPNQSTESDFVQLGFSSAMASRIINYRSKGGKFKTKADMLKMYGMDTTLYKNIYALINLPEVAVPSTKIQNTENDSTQKHQTTYARLDLNAADTTQLIKIYGIGKKLSERIVKYRNRLGGFVSMDQLKEVYGLDSTAITNAVREFTIEKNYQPVQININSASEKEMGAHPYLSLKLAKAITAYRFQHGHFAELDDLARVKLLSENDFEKIKPYLTLR
jgi:competence protein ComEA